MPVSELTFPKMCRQLSGPAGSGNKKYQKKNGKSEDKLAFWQEKQTTTCRMRGANICRRKSESAAE